LRRAPRSAASRSSASSRDDDPDEQGVGGQGVEPGPDQMTQPSGDPVPDDGVADGLAHDETGPGVLPVAGSMKVNHQS
jgi:hypothetical protein